MRITLALATVLALGSTAAFAQSTPAPTTTTPPTASTPSTTPPTAASIKDRKENQEDRVAQGVQSGQLTATETSTIEKQEAGINKEESGMRAQDDGKLTAQDKATLNSQLNAESQEIYADKHNTAVQPPDKGEVNERLDNQQDRIAAGINGDKLTDGEVATLEHQEAGIDKEEAGMRAQDNGKLTDADKKLLNKQLTQESRRISRAEARTKRRK
jgi:hypothetical protein